ncbi:MAG: hypothetical protein R6X02_34015 [Enhygromyxa sp.]
MLVPRRWLICVVLGCGCGSTPKVGEDPPVSAERQAPPEPATEPRAEVVVVVEAEPYTPDPEGFGDPCSADSECGWDDPCMPTRCVGAAHVPSDVNCDETQPAPGACSCVAGRCSLRPNQAPAEAPSCRNHGCGLDQGAGRCVAGSSLGANRQRRDVGPACHCDDERLECRFVWVEPIECETVEACWVSDSRPHHPVPRPKSKRGRKFRPCRDGEVGPACLDGRCSLVAHRC